jgi:hypothetical protein
MKFVTFDTDEHADAFLALMRRLEKDQSGFWHNRGFILERFRDVVIATVDDDLVLGFYISKDGPDGSRIVEIIQAFEERQGLGTLMMEDLCARYEPEHILCFEPLAESIGFWKQAGVRAIDRRKRVWSL